MNTALYGFALAAIGVICATVAVCLGQIDAPTYLGLVGPVLGVGVGFGVHAAGVDAGSTATATGTTPQASVGK